MKLLNFIIQLYNYLNRIENIIKVTKMAVPHF